MAGFIQFILADGHRAEEFVREYVLDTVDRAETIDGCAGITFAVNEPPHPDHETVGVGVSGGVDAFVETEQGRWETYRDKGIIEDWQINTRDLEQAKTKHGEQGAELIEKRLGPLSARMAKLVYEEFDSDEDFPAPVDTFPEDDGLYSSGWAFIPHHLTFANLGYSAAEEMDMWMFCIEEDLRIFAERNDEEAVDAKIDALIDALDTMREDVKEGRPQP